MHTFSTEMLQRGQCASTVNASQVAMTSCAKITRLRQTENRDEQSYHRRHSTSAPRIRFYLRSDRQSRRISTRSAAGSADLARGGWFALAPDPGAGGEIKLRGHSALDQRLRLEMEGVTFRGRRVNMKLHEYKFSGRSGKTAGSGRKALTAKDAKGARRPRRKP